MMLDAVDAVTFNSAVEYYHDKALFEHGSVSERFAFESFLNSPPEPGIQPI